jgi:hypothetical protein
VITPGDPHPSLFAQGPATGSDASTPGWSRLPPTYHRPGCLLLSTEADTQRSACRGYPAGRRAAGGAAIRGPAGEGHTWGKAWTRLSAGTGSGRCSRAGR